MENLSYEMLIQAYRAALKLNVDDEFIELLQQEMRRRERKQDNTPGFRTTR
ncbi:sporulation histidine kinase inhibitor Sda [Halobacillus sp. MO56]